MSTLMSPPFSQSNADGFWQVGPASSGEFQDALERHVRLCAATGADSQIVVRGGKIVSEWYSAKYAEPVSAMSSTKVVASLLVGMLVDRGQLAYEARVSSIIPEWTGGFCDTVTVEQLLTHSAGFRNRRNPGESIGYASDKREFVLRLTPDFAPACGMSTATRVSNFWRR